MKRVVFMVCVATMLVFGIFSSGYAIDYITDADVNVRNPQTHEKLKNMDGQSIVIRRWNIINVIDDTDRFWLRIKMDDGREGIVYKEYAHIGHAEELEEIQNRQKQGIKITNEDAAFIGIILEPCKVYKKPNEKVIGTIAAGEEIFIRQTGKYWYKIIWQNREIAYVSSKYVKMVDINVPGDGEIKVLSDKDNKVNSIVVRTEPSFEASKIITLKMKDYVRVVIDEVDGKWALVAYNSYGDTGYILKKYLHSTTLFE